MTAGESSSFKENLTVVVDDAKSLVNDVAEKLAGREDERRRSGRTTAFLHTDEYHPSADTTRGGGRVAAQNSVRE